MAITDLVQRVVAKLSNTKVEENFKTGDTVNVHVKITEGDKERIQVYKGVVIKVQGSGPTRSFTVRKVSSGVGVERTFPFSSPAVKSVELYSRGKVRRSRLFYIRNLSGRAARIESELVTFKSSKK